MKNSVKITLKQRILNPYMCIVCGATENLYPNGFSMTGNSSQLFINYWGAFHFTVCGECGTKRRELFEKKKRFRRPEENDFIKLYDEKAVQIIIKHHPLLGIKEAKFIFYRRDYAEAFARINHGELL